MSHAGTRPWDASWPADKPRSIELPSDTLWDKLARTAGRLPEKNAIVFYDAPVSYSRLLKEAEYIAGFLQANCGVQHGDRVALYAQNSPQFVIAYYAIIRAGAVVVPVNPMNLISELDYVLRDSGATTLFFAQDLVDQVHPLIDSGLVCNPIMITYADYLPENTSLDVPDFLSAPVRKEHDAVSLWRDIIAAGQLPAPYAGTTSDLAVFPYTSGSTGRSKACMHTHFTTLHAVHCCHQWFDIREDDTLLSVAPLFHVTGMQLGMNAPIAQGSTIVLLPRWNRHVAAELIERYRISFWPCVPTMVIDLVAMPDFESCDVSSLRILMGGGMAMPEAIAEKLRDLCGIVFVEGYGLSETMAPATGNPLSRPKPQCGGLPVFNTDILIIDPDTLEPVPLGETGEILVSGPQVMIGYWQDEDANAKSFVTIAGQRYLRTGDLGKFDDEGYIFILDRIKRMINASGFKVWPTEIESYLYKHPDVQEACVISAPDAKRGETVKAVIVLKPGSKEAPVESDIINWARDRMSAYKVPRLVEFTDHLPKSGSGKVLWREVQQAENRRRPGSGDE